MIEDIGSAGDGLTAQASRSLEPKRFQRRAARCLRASVGLSAVAVVAVSVSACGGSSGGGSSHGSGGIPSGPIKVGVDLPLSGPIGPIGLGVLRPIKTFAKQMNAAGGIDGHQVEIVSANDQDDPATGVANVQKMISNGVKVFLDAGFGAVTGVTTPLLMKSHIPLLVWEATDKYSQQTSVYPYFFNAGPDSAQQAVAQVNYMVSKGYKKIAVVTDGTPIGQDLLSVFKSLARSKGISIVTTQTYSATATSVVPQVQAVKASGAQAVLIAAETGAEALQQAFAQVGAKVAVVSDDAVAGQFTGSFAKGVVVDCEPGVAPGQMPPAVLAKASLAGAGTAIQYETPVFDSQLVLLKQVIQQANSTSGPALKAAFEKVNKVPTLPGLSYTFSATNHAGFSLSSIHMCHAQPAGPSGVLVRVQ